MEETFDNILSDDKLIELVKTHFGPDILNPRENTFASFKVPFDSQKLYDNRAPTINSFLNECTKLFWLSHFSVKKDFDDTPEVVHITENEYNACFTFGPDFIVINFYEP